MKTLNVIIERADNNFSAYLQEVDGIIAVGNSVAEIKQCILESIEVLIESCKELDCEIPQELLGEYTLSFKMDVKSVLHFYSSIFTKAALERITGINQKQLWHYANGKIKPRQAQRIKIEQGLHRLGNELISLHL